MTARSCWELASEVRGGGMAVLVLLTLLVQAGIRAEMSTAEPQPSSGTVARGRGAAVSGWARTGRDRGSRPSREAPPGRAAPASSDFSADLWIVCFSKNDFPGQQDTVFSAHGLTTSVSGALTVLRVEAKSVAS